MKCKHLKIKSKKHQKYIYCSKLKKEINFDNCKGCPFKEYKERKPIKNRTSKQAKMERERFSIFTKDLEHCILCAEYLKEIGDNVTEPAEAVNLHEIYEGNDNRPISAKYGLVLPLCYKHHKIIHMDEKQQKKWGYNNLKLIWHIKGQIAFEEKYPNLEFLEIFGRNYK